ncbi:MAG TPA: sigma-70 family RNA polymerase sigma factor [Candidatus Acidoferrales bacterium]|nr:sigma-70 family RNA polymerase sigma factor [Candidatus Acidoferrales bacterium]
MAERAEPRDVELLRRLAAGDEDAFLVFYRRHQGGLYRFALHMTGRPETAADVVQETFMTLMRAAGKFDAERGAPAAFLYGIARNHVRRAQEKDARYNALPEDGTGGNGANQNGPALHVEAAFAGEGVFEGLARAEAVQWLRQAVGRLPQHYREVVTLCDLEGRSYGEAAALLACPVGTVRSRLNRARDILLEKLRPAGAGTKQVAARWGGGS